MPAPDKWISVPFGGSPYRKFEHSMVDEHMIENMIQQMVGEAQQGRVSEVGEEGRRKVARAL